MSFFCMFDKIRDCQNSVSFFTFYICVTHDPHGVTYLAHKKMTKFWQSKFFVKHTIFLSVPSTRHLLTFGTQPKLHKNQQKSLKNLKNLKKLKIS